MQAWEDERPCWFGVPIGHFLNEGHSLNVSVPLGHTLERGSHSEDLWRCGVPEPAPSLKDPLTQYSPAVHAGARDCHASGDGRARGIPEQGVPSLLGYVGDAPPSERTHLSLLPPKHRWASAVAHQASDLRICAHASTMHISRSAKWLRTLCGALPSGAAVTHSGHDCCGRSRRSGPAGCVTERVPTLMHPFVHVPLGMLFLNHANLLHVVFCAAGGTNLNALLDTLLPNDSAGVQELLDETSAGNVWQRVLPMPAPLGHLEVGILEKLGVCHAWQRVQPTPCNPEPPSGHALVAANKVHHCMYSEEYTVKNRTGSVNPEHACILRLTICCVEYPCVEYPAHAAMI
eukprot:scaffold282238_cov22-Tisochrysis_lutea.AAC.2